MDLTNANFEIMASWNLTWAAAIKNDNLLCTISLGHTPTGFDLTLRKLWCTLNRVITYGRCADSLYKWGLENSPECDCGEDH
ncbi:Hypothetical protein CINCED_3A020212 [Cinara cedri]|uniref:Uncharacterized protein n=1 Tax=Cinara cedri TaxID=506608 RepID=A0A5E4M1F7_9HEMI|nr:Hypothetical protein CINCED_3A020212 [Cinara cedri]